MYRKTLHGYLQRQARLSTSIALPVACLYVLLAPQPFRPFEPIPWLFVALHAARLVWEVDRAPGTAFLFGRGYSRDALWTHKVLTLAGGAAMVCLPVSLIVWTGLRSAVQDTLFRNPLFPLLAPTETWVPMAWLVAYLVCLPAFLYASIRSAQPARRPEGGVAVLLAFLFAGFVLLNLISYRGLLVQWIVGASATTLALVLLSAARRLHRSMEVH